MIALILYILFVDYIYDAFAPLDSTNWAIFYFANHYIGLGLIALKSISIVNSSYIYLCIAIAVGFFVKAILEILKWNSLISEYYTSVNNIFNNTTFSLVVIGLIISFYAKQKNSNR